MEAPTRTVTELPNRRVEDMSELTLSELAEQANDAAKDVDGYASATVESAVRCGMLLLTAKEKVKHGQWQTWLEANFQKDIRQARRYMQIAKGTHASVLSGADSIRDAIRKIAGPKEGTEEHREEQIADLLRAGATQSSIVDKFHIQATTVKRIYEELVIPELLEVDWRSAVNKSLVKEIAAAELLPAIEAEYRSRGLTGGCHEWLVDEIKVTRALFRHAVKVIQSGVPTLVSRAKAGEIALSTAGDIAKLSIEEQAAQLATMDRKKTVDVIDDLRSRVSLMLDQKLGWNGQYTSDPDVFRDLRDNADSAEVAEIVRNLLLVRDWVATIASLLGDDQCSRQTNEPPHS